MSEEANTTGAVGPDGAPGAPLTADDMPTAKTITKVYSDGTSATGVPPLPDLSPAQQAAADAAAAAAQELQAKAEADAAAATKAASQAESITPESFRIECTVPPFNGPRVINGLKFEVEGEGEEAILVHESELHHSIAKLFVGIEQFAVRRIVALEEGLEKVEEAIGLKKKPDPTVAVTRPAKNQVRK